MLQQLYLGEGDIRRRWSEVKGYFWEFLEEKTKEVSRRILEGGLKVEAEWQIGCGRYEREESRRDYLNGYYLRDLIGSLGRIEGLRVPRSRKGVYRSEILGRYKRRTKAFDRAVYDGFIGGLSTRKVKEFFRGFFGEEVLSASGVSVIFKKIEGELLEFRRRKLKDEYEYLFLDGLSVRIRDSYKRKKVVLFALGVKKDGGLEVLDFRVYNSEKGCNCEGFLMNLKERGLEGKKLKLIIQDGAPGLKEAVCLLFSETPQQDCSVHRTRNIKKKYLLNPAHQKPMRKEAKEIFEAESKKEAIQKIEQFKEHWEKQEPKATKNFLKDIDLSLRFYECPRHLWKYLKSTNPLERLLREIRKRIRLYDSFSHEKSCVLIIYALIKKLNNQPWRISLASKK